MNSDFLHERLENYSSMETLNKNDTNCRIYVKKEVRDRFEKLYLEERASQKVNSKTFDREETYIPSQILYGAIDFYMLKVEGTVQPIPCVREKQKLIQGLSKKKSIIKCINETNSYIQCTKTDFCRPL